MLEILDNSTLETIAIELTALYLLINHTGASFVLNLTLNVESLVGFWNYLLSKSTKYSAHIIYISIYCLSGANKNT